MTASAPPTAAPFELDVYVKRGITLVRGQGSRLWDDRGREYLDAMSAQGAAILGHAHPALLAALTKQASTLSSCPGAFDHPERARLMERLVHVSPTGLDRVFLCNSGTEAIEAALKCARATTGRPNIVAAKRAFHGRSFGAMSVTFNPKDHALFAPTLPGIRFVPFNSVEALDAALDEETAVLLLELVQGEGGVHPAEAAFVEHARDRCRKYGILLAIDEIQTGFGRTGRLFACEHYGLSPDILCLAKGIAGGFPMGAVLVGERARLPVGSHGSTFGGNPLACAVANAVLDCLEAEGFIQEVEAKGKLFAGLLAELVVAPVTEARGLGLMWGLQLGERARPHLEALAASGVLALPAGPKVLRLLPPLTTSRHELEEIALRLQKVLQAGR